MFSLTAFEMVTLLFVFPTAAVGAGMLLVLRRVQRMQAQQQAQRIAARPKDLPKR